MQHIRHTIIDAKKVRAYNDKNVRIFCVKSQFLLGASFDLRGLAGRRGAGAKSSKLSDRRVPH